MIKCAVRVEGTENRRDPSNDRGTRANVTLKSTAATTTARRLGQTVVVYNVSVAVRTVRW